MSCTIKDNLYKLWESVYEWFFPTPQSTIERNDNKKTNKLNLKAFIGYSTYRNLDLREWITEKKIHLPFHLWVPLACNYNLDAQKSEVKDILPEMIRTTYSFKTHMEIENLIPQYKCLITLTQKQKEFLGLHDGDLQGYELLDENDQMLE
jgi:hypothetical protein